MSRASGYSLISMGSRELLDQLDQPSHIRQLRIYGVFPSRAAFARALIAAKLAYGTVSTVSANVRDYGGEDDRPDGELWQAPLAEPGALFIAALNDYDRKMVKVADAAVTA